MKSTGGQTDWNQSNRRITQRSHSASESRRRRVVSCIIQVVLSSKAGKKAWIEPSVDHSGRTISYRVKTGEGTAPEGTVSRRSATCLVCGTVVPLEHVREECSGGRMGTQLMAMVTEDMRQRIYVDPDCFHEQVAASAEPCGVPETALPEKALGFRVQAYGMTRHRDLFTNRQLGPVHTKRSASTMSAKERNPRKRASSFSKREKIRRKPLSLRNRRSISLRFL